MKKSRIPLIREYLEKLKNELDNYVDGDDNSFHLSDLIQEIVGIFKSDFPNIGDELGLNNNTIERDGKIVLSKLKLALIALGFSFENKEKANYTAFWISFITWFEEGNQVKELLRDEYVYYDNWNGGTYYANIDYSYEYRLHRGIEIETDDIKKDCSSNGIKSFIELAYENWISTDTNKRYKFTIDVNKKLNQFQLPYRLQSGKLIKQGHKTTYSIETIINYQMFERKIQYAEEMISSSELLDKKVALDYIIDSLQYFISIQEGRYIKDKYKACSKTVSGSEENNIFNLINKEIDELMKIANESFDIRHNEYLNKMKEKREALDNPQFVEYLYNRAYSLLHLLRLNTDSK